MKTVDISGFGKNYEICCQTMLLRGMAFLAANPDFTFEGAYAGIKGVTGICMPKSKNAETLDDVITKDLGVTGAMHQAVIGHLAFIHRNGYQKWLDEFPEDRKYDIDPEMLEPHMKREKEIWEAKIMAGYDPLENIRKIIPEDQWINIDDPEEVVKKIKQLLEITEH